MRYADVDEAHDDTRLVWFFGYIGIARYGVLVLEYTPLKI